MKRRYPAQSTLRRAAASVLAISALTLASGCSITNPRETTGAYLPADGVAADLGPVALRDLVLVSDGKDAAVLAGSAINSGDTKITVQFSPQGESTTSPWALDDPTTSSPRPRLARRRVQGTRHARAPLGCRP